MPYTVLFSNPHAHSGTVAQWIDRARTLLRDVGIEHESIFTQPNGGTVELVRRAIDEDGARCVIAMGGDGTFADVAKGILASDRVSEVTMGVLPTGTANNQGKSFGMNSGPSSLKENVRTIAEGKTILLDAGRLQLLSDDDRAIATDWFFDSMSVGWGAQIVALSNRDRAVVSSIPLARDFYRDQLVYAGAIIRHFVASFAIHTKFDVFVEIDGVSYHYPQAIDIIVKNTLVYGGEWIPARDSLPDDGYFELVPVTGRLDFVYKALANLRYTPAIALQNSETVRGSSFLFTIMPHNTKGVPAAQIDGEEYLVGHRFRIDVQKQVLRSIVPRSYAKEIGDRPNLESSGMFPNGQSTSR